MILLGSQSVNSVDRRHDVTSKDGSRSSGAQYKAFAHSMGPQTHQAAMGTVAVASSVLMELRTMQRLDIVGGDVMTPLPLEGPFHAIWTQGGQKSWHSALLCAPLHR